MNDNYNTTDASDAHNAGGTTPETVLKKYFGHDSFRDGQKQIISELRAGRDVLGIMPTGGGKSICYQVPAIMAEGITIVVSPLISLMKDQVSALVQSGIRGAFYNSSLSDAQCRKALANIAAGMYKIIYVAPERLENETFVSICQRLDISYIAVDEAHCVSQWGQDFRPSYLKIPEFIKKLPKRPVIGAFTATATDEVRADIINILGLKDPFKLTTGFDRPNLYFEVRRPKTKRDKFEELMDILSEHRGKSGIIYCSTRKTVDELYFDLLRMRVDVTRYHAGLSTEERQRSQDDFIYDRCPVIVATNAFGMGIDKSNVSFVVHYNMPKNIENYYQEAGRAGRDGSNADCIMLYSPKDIFTIKYFIDFASGNEEMSEEMRGKIRAKDMYRMNRMIDYCTESGCLRNYILGYFGEKRYKPCGNCSECIGIREKTLKRLPLKTDPKPKEKKPRRAALPDVRPELFERLRAKRLQIAKTQGVPPYVVFNDSTLKMICQMLPRSYSELLNVPGIGETKAQRYGKTVLAEVEKYLNETAPKSGQTKEEAVIADYERGMRIAAIALKHGLSVGETEYMIKHRKR